jgi:hypothetical protein
MFKKAYTKALKTKGETRKLRGQRADGTHVGSSSITYNISGAEEKQK